MIAIRISPATTAVAYQKGRMNAELSPRSAYASDSLAEAYLKSGSIKNVMNIYL
jgi:hypothetical protein